MFSVGSTEEANALLVLTCPRDLKMRFVARELAGEQTLENLAAFSDRLAAAHEALVRQGRCDCVAGP